MYFLQFKKQYGISLLPEAFNNVTLGDLLFVGSLGKRPTSIITSLPTHIYNLFGYQAVISRKKWQKRISGFKNETLLETPLLSQRLVASPALIKTIKNDFLALLLLNFIEDPSVIEVAFSHLQQQNMSIKSRKRIRKLILRSPKEDGENYKRRILTVNMATRLYFGDLCIITDKKNSLEIDRLLLHYPIKPINLYLEEDKHIYEFSFKENPFCMILEPLTDFGAG